MCGNCILIKNDLFSIHTLRYAMRKIKAGINSTRTSPHTDPKDSAALNIVLVQHTPPAEVTRSCSFTLNKQTIKQKPLADVEEFYNGVIFQEEL